MISLYSPETQPTWLPIFTACQPLKALATYSSVVTGIIHHRQKPFDVVRLHIFNRGNRKLLFQKPLEVANLLSIIVNCLGRQMPDLAVKFKLLSGLIKRHAIAPLPAYCNIHYCTVHMTIGKAVNDRCDNHFRYSNLPLVVCTPHLPHRLHPLQHSRMPHLWQRSPKYGRYS